MKKKIKKIILKIIQNYKKWRKINFIAGDEVLCPICNSKFKFFDSYGIIKRANAECYNCGSLERHRLLWKYLNEKMDFFKQKRKIKILHFAPENIFYDIFNKNDNFEYIPCDLFPEKYKYDGTNKIRKVNITNIPFNDNYFDFILCNHVLEHIPNDSLAMSELFRVMKKGGYGIFQVPIDYNREVTYEDFKITDAKEREKKFGQSDHVRLYGKDYERRLENAGFNVNVDDFIKKFSTKELFKFGLTPSELIYNCKKK